jgi:hypothetical protein
MKYERKVVKVTCVVDLAKCITALAALVYALHQNGLLT